MDENGLGEATIETNQDENSSLTFASGISNGPEINVDPPHTQLTIIDGNTPVDDVLFASVFASMDLAVLKELEEAPPVPEEKPAGVDISQLSEMSSYSPSDDESDVSDEDVSVSGVDAFNDEPSDEGRLSRAGDVGDLDMFAKLPEALDAILQNLPDSTAGPFEPIGHCLSFIGPHLLTVKAHAPISAEKTFDIGSTCCLSNGRVIGMIIDTFGPTHSPFYVVRRKDEETREIVAGTDLFIDRERSTIALIDSSPSTDMGLEDDSIVDTSRQIMEESPIQQSISQTHPLSRDALIVNQTTPNSSAGTHLGHQVSSRAPPPWAVPSQLPIQRPPFIPPPPPPQ